MIKFFRRFRQQLLAENKFSKYVLYAIGEIILVVIGILIALQINNWNTQRIDSKKGQTLLLEIRENLNEDLQNIDAILDFNESKLQAIDSAYYYMSRMNDNPNLGKKFSNLLPVITNYEIFTPNKVAFNNLVSSGNIELLSSDELRKTISRYYTNNRFDGIQDQLILTTQEFLNEVAPKMINARMLKFITTYDFDLQTVEDIRVHKDPFVLSDLFVMMNKTREHNKILNTAKGEIKTIIESIDTHLNG